MIDEYVSNLTEFLGDEKNKEIINYDAEKVLFNLLNEITEEDATRKEIAAYKRTFINLRDNCDCSNTLLHFIARGAMSETMNRLLTYEVDVNVKNNKKRTPIFYAIKNCVEMVKVLLVDSYVNYWDLFRQALLIYGTEEIVSLLVNKLLAIQNNSQQHALSTMNSKFDETQKTEILIEGFLQHELHLLHMEESYPLLIFFAARLCRKDILHIILDDCRKNLATIKQKKIRFKGRIRYEPPAPEELNVQGKNCETALLYAAGHQSVEAIRFLLEEGADPNCHDFYYQSPLYLAALLENEEICLLLLTFKANPNFNTIHNPLYLVCGAYTSRHFWHSVEYYLNLDNEREFTIGKKGYVFNFNIMRLLLKNGANPDIERQPSLLHKACILNNLKAVDVLLEYGANIYALDSSGNSALHYTARGDSFEIVDFLLEKGFNIDLQNNDNNTPLMFGVKENGSNFKMIEYLISCGADVNAMNVWGETALHIAICKGKDIVERLLELGADCSIVNMTESRLNEYPDLSLQKHQIILISFIALRENQLSDNIKFYVGNSNNKFKKAFAYFQRSKLDIRKLKTAIIHKIPDVSCFDFLTMDFYSAVQIAKNSDIRSFLKTDICRDLPCYQTLLKNRLELIAELEDFIGKTFNFILNITNLLPEIVEIIMSYLRITDFLVLGRK